MSARGAAAPVCGTTRSEVEAAPDLDHGEPATPDPEVEAPECRKLSDGEHRIRKSGARHKREDRRQQRAEGRNKDATSEAGKHQEPPKVSEAEPEAPKTEGEEEKGAEASDTEPPKDTP